MRRLAKVAAVLTAALAAALIPSLHAHAAGYNPIYAAYSLNVCVDDPSNNGQSGDLLIIGSCSLQGAQWTYASQGSGYYELILKNVIHGNMCIDDRGGSSGTQVAIKLCNGSVSQKWYAVCIPTTSDGLNAQPLMENARGMVLYTSSAYSLGDAITIRAAGYPGISPQEIFWGQTGMPVDNPLGANGCPTDDGVPG